MSSIRECANIKSALLKYDNMIERSKIKFTKKVFKMPLLDDNSSAIN